MPRAADELGLELGVLASRSSLYHQLIVDKSHISFMLRYFIYGMGGNEIRKINTGDIPNNRIV